MWQEYFRTLQLYPPERLRIFRSLITQEEDFIKKMEVLFNKLYFLHVEQLQVLLH